MQPVSSGHPWKGSQLTVVSYRFILQKIREKPSGLFVYARYKYWVQFIQNIAPVQVYLSFYKRLIKEPEAAGLVYKVLLNCSIVYRTIALLSQIGEIYNK